MMISLMLAGCGYRMMTWSSERYQTIHIADVTAGARDSELAVRLQNALIERILGSSGLSPSTIVDSDLVLHSEVTTHEDQVVATDVDGRTRRIQFTIRADFRLLDRDQNLLWQLDDYRFTDQYEVSTTSQSYRDEAVFIEDTALQAVSDLVVSSFSLALAEREGT